MKVNFYNTKFEN